MTTATRASMKLLSVVVLFVFFILWWGSLQLRASSDDARQLFAACYGVVALWGGMWGLRSSNKWGGLKSVFGKAIFLLACGLFAQEFGQLAYSYYIYARHIDVPYPSIGDIGYASSVGFYIAGAVLLARTAGVKLGLKTFANKLQAVLIPTALVAFSYILFLRNYTFDFSAPLTIFLDFGYPLGQALYVSIAILTFSLSRKVLGGVMRPRILLLLAGFVLQYLADFVFLYQNSQNLWQVGRINDAMYLVSYTIMAFSLIELGVIADTMRGGSSKK